MKAKSFILDHRHILQKNGVRWGKRKNR